MIIDASLAREPRSPLTPGPNLAHPAWRDAADAARDVLHRDTHDEWNERAAALIRLGECCRSVRKPGPPPEILARAVDAGLRDPHGAVARACGGCCADLVNALRLCAGPGAPRESRAAAQNLVRRAESKSLPAGCAGGLQVEDGA